MRRIVKGTSTCAGIALWAFGCSSPAAEKTVVVVVGNDAGVGGGTNAPDAAVVNPPALDAAVVIPPVPDAAVVTPPVPDAEVCNQAGAAACDGAIGAMCARFSQCCLSITSCEPWAKDVTGCKAYFAGMGLNCAAPEFTSKLVCASRTKECQDDVPLIACADVAFGTANWPASCNTLWTQFR